MVQLHLEDTAGKRLVPPPLVHDRQLWMATATRHGFRLACGSSITPNAVRLAVRSDLGGTVYTGTAYAVDPQELQRTSVQLTAETARLEEVLSGTQRSVDALRSVWQGSSHAHYESLYAEWQRGAQAIRHALGSIAAMTAKASAIYTEGDHGVSALISGV